MLLDNYILVAVFVLLVKRDLFFCKEYFMCPFPCTLLTAANKYVTYSFCRLRIFLRKAYSTTHKMSRTKAALTKHVDRMMVFFSVNVLFLASASVNNRTEQP